MEQSGPARYGKYYWCVKVPKTVSPDGEIYVHADRAETKCDGSLIFVGRDGKFNNLILAPGQWIVAFSASLMDGSAVAVEHWKTD